MAKITFRLNTKDIERAIKEVEQYAKGIESKGDAVVQALVMRGQEIVQEELESLVYSEPGEEFRTGELKNSIYGSFDPVSGKGYVRTDLPYAKYVEFGTGMVGAGEPHPEAGEAGWKYDVNEHGEGGWLYFNPRDGKWHRTKGFRSRPFMYNTARRLEREAARIAKEVFRRDRH